VAHSFGGSVPDQVAPLLWVSGKSGNVVEASQEANCLPREPGSKKSERKRQRPGSHDPFRDLL
jgi:hypothetical protein